jgi:polyphosphate glucokinase
VSGGLPDKLSDTRHDLGKGDPESAQAIGRQGQEHDREHAVEKDPAPPGPQLSVHFGAPANGVQVDEIVSGHPESARCSPDQPVAEETPPDPRRSRPTGNGGMPVGWSMPPSRADPSTLVKASLFEDGGLTSSMAPRASGPGSPRVLVIDVGGTHVKVMVTGQRVPRKIPSGPEMTARRMVSKVKQMAAEWPYDVVSIGYPGPVAHGYPIRDLVNIGGGWVGFDFRRAFGHPVKLLNDAAMQAMGSYEGGRMLFLGLGTGLGSTMIADGIVEPFELAHLPYKGGRSYEDYVGARGLKKFGKKKWRKYVLDVISRLQQAVEPEYIVIGGGNAKKLRGLPRNARLGDNRKAMLGGFLAWRNEGG